MAFRFLFIRNILFCCSLGKERILYFSQKTVIYFLFFLAFWIFIGYTSP